MGSYMTIHTAYSCMYNNTIYVHVQAVHNVHLTDVPIGKCTRTYMYIGMVCDAGKRIYIIDCMKCSIL